MNPARRHDVTQAFLAANEKLDGLRMPSSRVMGFRTGICKKFNLVFVERDDDVLTKYTFATHTAEINLTAYDKKFGSKHLEVAPMWALGREIYFYHCRQDHVTDLSKINWEQTASAVAAGYNAQKEDQARENN